MNSTLDVYTQDPGVDEGEPKAPVSEKVPGERVLGGFRPVTDYTANITIALNLMTPLSAELGFDPVTRMHYCVLPNGRITTPGGLMVENSISE